MPHGWAAWWFAAYGALLAMAVTLAVLRRGATLWRGRAFLVFNVLFVGLAAGVTLAVTGSVPVAAALVGGALLLGSWAVQSRWLVVGADEANVGRAIEGCARRICAPYERIDGSYRVPLRGGELRVRLRRVGARATLLTFEAAPHHRKTELFQELLAKQYHGALPTVRIPLR